MSQGKDHKDYLELAVQIAYENVQTGKGGPFGCVIVKDGQVIAKAGNQVTSLNDPTAHAEIMAIRQACQKLNIFHLDGCILYTSCEPCPMCFAAIYWAHLDEVFFCNGKDIAQTHDFDDQFIYDEVALMPEKRKVSMQYMAVEDAGRAFAAWTKSDEKVRY